MVQNPRSELVPAGRGDALLPEVHDPAYDRFVAFMFGAADLLVETDPRGHISFVAGATQRLPGDGAGLLLGRPFTEMFVAEDRVLAEARFNRVQAQNGMMPAVVRMKQDGAPAVMFGGCALPNGHTVIFLAVAQNEADRLNRTSTTSEGMAGLQSPIAFAATVRDRFKGTDAGERRLTLIALDGLSPQVREALPEIEQQLLARLPSDRRVGGKVLAVGRIADTRYGILHDGPLDSGGLRRHVRKLALQVAPEAPQIQLTSTAIRLRPGTLRSDIVATSAVYIMARMANSADGALNQLRRANLAQLMVETTNRIATLRQILETADFDLAHQPIVAFDDHKVHHVEALIRFRDGRAPNEWIALAEAADIVTELDLAVCHRALALLAKAGPDEPPVAINLSGRSLEHAPFVAELHALLDGQPDDLTQRLMFELTESAVVRDIEAVDLAVQGLRRRGFKVCLDDFGAVATSIHYLRSIKVDYVKVDGLFARSSLRNSNDRSILSHVIGLCRSVGAGVIVEMIETEEQGRAFQELGADFAQGYYFGTPAITPESAASGRMG